jgi:uncharacterized phage protein (TIGR01671 family)
MQTNNKILKFRAWDNINKCLYTKPFFILHSGPLFILNEDYLSYENFDAINPVMGLSIQQFTGLLDINNKEIYEGDIVEITYTDATPDGRLEFETVKRKVKWDSVELKWGLEYPDFNTFSERLSDYKGNIKIIGNIFESPQLLNN